MKKKSPRRTYGIRNAVVFGKLRPQASAFHPSKMNCSVESRSFLLTLVTHTRRAAIWAAVDLLLCPRWTGEFTQLCTVLGRVDCLCNCRTTALHLLARRPIPNWRKVLCGLSVSPPLTRRAGVCCHRGLFGPWP